MPKFRKAEAISDTKLSEALDSIAYEGLYVYASGAKYRGRKGSARFRALSTLKKGELVTLETLLRRAARAEGGTKGYDPATIRAGVRLHQGAKPASFLLLREDSEGNLVAETDVPTAPEGVGAKSFEEGAVVFPKGKRPTVAS